MHIINKIITNNLKPDIKNLKAKDLQRKGKNFFILYPVSKVVYMANYY